MRGMDGMQLSNSLRELLKWLKSAASSKLQWVRRYHMQMILMSSRERFINP